MDVMTEAHRDRKTKWRPTSIGKVLSSVQGAFSRSALEFYLDEQAVEKLSARQSKKLLLKLAASKQSGQSYDTHGLMEVLLERGIAEKLIGSKHLKKALIALSKERYQHGFLPTQESLVDEVFNAGAARALADKGELEEVLRELSSIDDARMIPKALFKRAALDRFQVAEGESPASLLSTRPGIEAEDGLTSLAKWLLEGEVEISVLINLLEDGNARSFLSADFLNETLKSLIDPIYMEDYKAGLTCRAIIHSHTISRLDPDIVSKVWNEIAHNSGFYHGFRFNDGQGAYPFFTVENVAELGKKGTLHSFLAPLIEHGDIDFLHTLFDAFEAGAAAELANKDHREGTHHFEDLMRKIAGTSVFRLLSDSPDFAPLSDISNDRAFYKQASDLIFHTLDRAWFDIRTYGFGFIHDCGPVGTGATMKGYYLGDPKEKTGTLVAISTECPVGNIKGAPPSGSPSKRTFGGEDPIKSVLAKIGAGVSTEQDIRPVPPEWVSIPDDVLLLRVISVSDGTRRLEDHCLTR